MGNCRQPVCHYYRRSIFSWLPDIIDKPLLVFCIDCTECIIEDQDLMILYQASRNRNPLFLAAGEGDALFPDHRIKTVRHPSEIRIQCTQTDGLLQFLLCRTWAAEPYIRFHRP